MTKAQIEYLKLLGYTNTQEDGAILQNKRFFSMDCFVWKGEKFKDVLSEHNRKLSYANKKEAVEKILK